MSYRDLKSYRQATVVYDFTAEFCERYVDTTNKTNKTYRSRMYDQMVQAARSGKQNIVEGSAQRTSSKNELKLLGVARASFEELLHDYEDFLRQRGLKQWDKDEPLAQEVRALAYRTDRTNRTDRSNGTDKTYRTYESYRSYLDNSETAANAAICLINQTNYLLDRQIKSLENKFIKQGGWNEKIFWQRENEKKKELVNRFWRKHE